MLVFKIYEGTKILDTKSFASEEEAWAYGRKISERPKRLNVELVGAEPVNIVDLLPFLTDIPDEIYKEAAATA